jgi:hypothetical protein
MATAGDIIDEVLVRARDTTSGDATTRAQVLDLVDRVQLIVVRATGSLINDRNLSAVAEQALYDLDPDDTLRVVDVFDNNARRFSPSRWSKFIQTRIDWWRHQETTTAHFQVWAQAGVSKLILWPPDTTATPTLVVREQQMPTRLAVEGTALDLPEQYHDTVRNIVEALILLRMRDLDAAEAVIARLEGP